MEHMDRMSDKIANIYADHAGGTAEQWRDLMRKESWYKADEAVDAHLADEVVASVSASNASNLRTMFDLSMFSYAGRENAPAPEVIQEEVPEADPFVGLGEELLKALKGAFA
jgi:hypothetical protein